MSEYDEGKRAGEQAAEIKEMRNDINILFGMHKDLMGKLDMLIPAVAKLEVKAGIWGGIGGLMAALVVISIAFLKM